MNQETIEYAKKGCDWLCGGLTVATIVGAIPAISGVLTAVYVAARLMETVLFKKVLRAVCSSCAAWWEA